MDAKQIERWSLEWWESTLAVGLMGVVVLGAAVLAGVTVYQAATRF